MSKIGGGSDTISRPRNESGELGGRITHGGADASGAKGASGAGEASEHVEPSTLEGPTNEWRNPSASKGDGKPVAPDGSSGTSAGSDVLPTANEPTKGIANGGSDAFKSILTSYQSILKSGGNATQVNADDFKKLAQAFPNLSSAEQSTLKQSLNTLFPGKSGTAGGDALQFAADGVKNGDADAAKNRLQDLQKG